ncbi:DNA-binding response OmpR family regulator [Aeromicrobium sp. SORGH_AS981]|nr:DNA-binding response OmpR family regulator [Aeromicrobium sp. SORGH_AS_0981]
MSVCESTPSGVVEHYGDPMVRILVVEDDLAIRTTLTRGLTDHGAVVTAVGTAVEAIRSVGAEQPDVVMLDLGLPDLDGADVLALVRSSSDVPVVVATARDDEREIVRLLDAGADDYLVKPFSAAQAMARVRAVLRRTAPAGAADRTVRVGGLVVDPVSREVAVEGRAITLNRKEFDLLLALATRAGEVVSKRELLADVWQMPWGGADRTVDVHLSWLRRKLGESAAAPRYLHSVRGVGVKLVAPDPASGADA